MITRQQKIVGGKLLRVRFERTAERISHISITGDFFIYPESAVEEIESIITKYSACELQQELEEYVKNKHIQIIGFEIKDLINLIES